MNSRDRWHSYPQESLGSPETLVPYMRTLPCPLCDIRILFGAPRREVFDVIDAGHLVTMHATVEAFHCSTCGFEFTDCEAELARDVVVAAYFWPCMMCHPHEARRPQKVPAGWRRLAATCGRCAGQLLPITAHGILGDVAFRICVRCDQGPTLSSGSGV